MEITAMFQCHVKDVTWGPVSYDNCVTSWKDASNLRRYPSQAGSVQSITSGPARAVLVNEKQNKENDVVQTHCCLARHASGLQPGADSDLRDHSAPRWLS